MTATAPVASVLLPVLNEERDIDAVLDAVLAQTETRIEVLVADGGSTDRTVAMVERRAEADRRIRLLSNPGRIQAAGLNVARGAARADVLVRVDGHSFIPPDYVERCLALLASTGGAGVGGRMVATGDGTPTSDAVALAVNGWWGAGPAGFHHDRGGVRSAETVYLGCYRSEAVEAVGGWATDVGVNEDYELNHRLREAGDQIYFDPTLTVGYRPRGSYRGVARQYFRYGASKAIVMTRHPGSVRARQLLPAALLPAVVGGTGRGVLGRACRMVLLAWLATLGTAAAAERASVTRRIAAVGVAADMHLSWAAGLWTGIARSVARHPHLRRGWPFG